MRWWKVPFSFRKAKHIAYEVYIAPKVYRTKYIASAGHKRVVLLRLFFSIMRSAKPSPPALGGGGTAKRWEVPVSSFINQLNRTFHHSAVLCRKIKFWARLKVNCNIKLNKRWSPFLPQAAGRRGFALGVGSSLAVILRRCSTIYSRKGRIYPSR